MTDTTDRQLLERAARAAGWVYHGPGKLDVKTNHGGWIDPETGAVHWEDLWNPLTSSADAFELAVKLGLDVKCPGVALSFRHRFEERNGAPYAATRRAIVRAAASMDAAPQRTQTP